MTDPCWSAAAPSVTIDRHAPACIWALRLRRPSPEALRRIGEAIGIDLPPPGRIARGAGGRLTWFGLHEWLAVGDLPLADALAAATDEVAASLVTDVTDAVVAYRLVGPDAATVLAKGCTIDVHPRAFAVDRCAQTVFAQVPVTIERDGDAAFSVIADRSHARHLDRWFEDALVEFHARKPEA